MRMNTVSRVSYWSNDIQHTFSNAKSRCGIGADLAAEGGYLGGPLKADRE
jgi:hypothetical protein